MKKILPGFGYSYWKPDKIKFYVATLSFYKKRNGCKNTQKDRIFPISGTTFEREDFPKLIYHCNLVN